LPDTLTTIGQEAFCNCINLERINFEGEQEGKFASNDLSLIGQRAFGINSVGPISTAFNMKLKLIELPPYLTSLGGSAFYYGGPNIKIKSLPDSLETLNSWVFCNCPNV
jgi:hypothetical protein